MDMRAETVKEAIGSLIDKAIEAEKAMRGDLMLNGFQIIASFQGVDQVIGIRWLHNGSRYGADVIVGHHGIFTRDGLKEE